MCHAGSSGETGRVKTPLLAGLVPDKHRTDTGRKERAGLTQIITSPLEVGSPSPIVAYKTCHGRSVATTDKQPYGGFRL